MPAMYVHRLLQTHVRRLADGRRVTIRRAVPSDAARLVALGSRDATWGSDLIAFDDHGAVAGHAASTTDVAVAGDWAASGLDELLASELREV